MKNKKLLAGSLLLLATSVGFGQCPDNLNISFTSQAEVEAFATNYPNCTDIYQLSIEGNNITSLESLHFLTSITVLYIAENNMLTSLSGLENISTTDCYMIQIIDNPVLVDLSQLSGISGFVDRLEIVNNDALVHLIGLQNIEEYISGFTYPITISDNDNLLSLQGLEGLIYAEAVLEDPENQPGMFFDVVIEDNDALQSLEGLGSISNLYRIHIKNNNALPNLNGLQNQASIGMLYVEGNDGLMSSDGLKQGAEINEIYFEANNGLVTLNGLDSLSYVENLIIMSNENLTDITSLPDFTDAVTIDNNGNLTSLTAFAGITAEDVRSVSFERNEILSSLGNLQDIKNLRSLGIYSNPSLGNLEGLHNLKQVESWLYLAENESLNDITALSMLDTVGNLIIKGNPSLESLLGFAIDTAHFTSVTIKDNLNLPVCEAVSICNFLQNFSEEDNEVEIVNNAPGCNSKDEVEAACGIIGVDEVIFNPPLLRVSPNPADAFIEVSLGGENQRPVNDVRIFDGMGRLVYQNEPESLLYKMDTKNLPEGIYVVLVNGRYSEKLVIQKWD